MFTKTSTQLKDQYGFVVENTPMDEIRVAEVTRLVGSTFEGTTIDTNFWTAVTGGTGTGINASATQANGELTLSSGTLNGNNSYTTVTSVRTGRYIGSAANRYRAQIRLGDTGAEGNYRRWGCFNANDGAFFELSGTTMNVVTRKGTVDTKVSSTSWNKNGVVPTLTSINSYEIYYTNKNVYFVIGGVLMHQVTATVSWSDSKNFNVRAESVNTTAATSKDLIVLVSTIVRFGKAETTPQMVYISGTTTGQILKRSQGSLHSLIFGSAANGAVVTIYDGTSTGGAVMAKLTVVFPGGGNFNPNAIDFKSIPFFTGLFVVVATANVDISIIYE